MTRHGLPDQPPLLVLLVTSNGPCKIVVRVVNRDHMAMVLKLLRERIGKPRELPKSHPKSNSASPRS